MNFQAFKDHLIWAEALKLFPYRCSANKLTIGVGRNLDDRGISEDEAMFMLGNDMRGTVDECRGLDYWNSLDEVRQLCIADMVFNLGMAKYKRFVNLNYALGIQDYNLAAQEMIDSRWYEQTGRRAKKLVKAMQTGEWEES